MPGKVVSIDSEKVQVWINEVTRALGDSSWLMSDIGHYLIYSILKRTSEGKDAEGVNFKKYSPEYKKLRELIDLPTDHADLFFGGSMLSALTFEEDEISVKLFFMDTPHVEHTTIPGRKRSKSKTTNAELAFYNDETRPFFAISVKEQENIFNMVNDFIENALKGK